MDSQSCEPEGEERNEGAQTPTEADGTSGSTSLESITWKGLQSAAELIDGDGIRFDRLTQLLASVLSRRRLGGIVAATLAGFGLQLQGDTVVGKRKKKKKKKKK